jgi:hypothetical protein
VGGQLAQEQDGDRKRRRRRDVVVDVQLLELVVVAEPVVDVRRRFQRGSDDENVSPNDVGPTDAGRRQRDPGVDVIKPVFLWIRGCGQKYAVVFVSGKPFSAKTCPGRERLTGALVVILANARAYPSEDLPSLGWLLPMPRNRVSRKVRAYLRGEHLIVAILVIFANIRLVWKALPRAYQSGDLTSLGLAPVNAQK